MTPKTSYDCRKMDMEPMADTAILTEEDVCARVRDSVLEQRLAPGTKLTEESLCSIFGVGRTTVRRAFLLLKRDNIIELHRNRGAIVASPTPEEARQVFESRRLVETALLEITANKVQPDDIKRLQEHLNQEREALSKADIAGWIRLTGEFHMKLAQVSGNGPICSFLEQLVFQTSLIVALYGPAGTPTNCSGHDHQSIVDALASNDVGHASTLMIQHLCEIEDQLKFEPRKEYEDLYGAFAQARSA